MTDEYFAAVKNFNLSWDEVVQLGRNSLEYSFAQSDQKQRLLDSYNQAVREFEQILLHLCACRAVVRATPGLAYAFCVARTRFSKMQFLSDAG